MTTLLFANNASAVTAGSISYSDTEVMVGVGQGELFPSPGADEACLATLGSGATSEIVRITGRSSDTMTIVRAQDGTEAQAWPAGTLFQALVVREDMESFVQSDNLGAEVNSADPIEAPIVDGVVTIDLSAHPGGIFYTTVDGDFEFDVVPGAKPSWFVHQTIGNGNTFSADFSFAKFPFGVSPIPTATASKVDTYGYLYRDGWWGFIMGQNA